MNTMRCYVALQDFAPKHPVICSHVYSQHSGFEQLRTLMQCCFLALPCYIVLLTISLVIPDAEPVICIDALTLLLP